MDKKEMINKINSAAKEYVGFFEKEVLPNIKKEIAARDVAAKNFKAADRLAALDEEIKELNAQLDKHRKEAAVSADHETIMPIILNTKQKIESLKEIRKEIENTVLPTAQKHLDKANNLLSKAALRIIEEIANKERKGMIQRINEIAIKIDAYHEAMNIFRIETLGVSHGKNNAFACEVPMSIVGIGYY